MDIDPRTREFERALERKRRVSIVGRTRLNLDITSELRERLDALREKSGLGSISEVVRFSLALYEQLLEDQKDGSKLVRHHPDGTDETLQIIFP